MDYTQNQKLRNSEFIEDTLGVLKNIKYLGPLRSSNQKTRDSVIVEQIPLGRDAEYFYQYFHNFLIKTKAETSISNQFKVWSVLTRTKVEIYLQMLLVYFWLICFLK